MSDFSNNILTNITADVYTASLGFTAAASFLGGAQFMLGAFGFLYYIFGMNREQHNTETTASNRKGGTVMENGLMNLQFRIVKLILNSACIANALLYTFIVFDSGDQICNSIAKAGEFSTHILCFSIEVLLLYRMFLVVNVENSSPAVKWFHYVFSSLILAARFSVSIYDTWALKGYTDPFSLVCEYTPLPSTGYTAVALDVLVDVYCTVAISIRIFPVVFTSGKIAYEIAKNGLFRICVANICRTFIICTIYLLGQLFWFVLSYEQALIMYSVTVIFEVWIMTFEEVFGMGVTTVIDFIARYFLKSRNYAQNSSSPDGSSYISTSQSAAAVRNVSTYTSNMSSSNGAPPAILPLPSIVGRSSNINRMV